MKTEWSTNILFFYSFLPYFPTTYRTILILIHFLIAVHAFTTEKFASLRFDLNKLKRISSKIIKITIFLWLCI